jgi:short subunit dehydrogenase-like uncharacterized protein
LREGTPEATNPFSYEERMAFGRGWRGKLQAQAATLALALFNSAQKFEAIRRMIGKLGPKPGEGPSEAKRAKGFYRGALIGRAKSVPLVKVTADWPGDPSNEITVTLAAEIARLLSEESSQATLRGKGFTTSSVALAEPLLARLEAVGFAFRLAPFAAGDS